MINNKVELQNREHSRTADVYRLYPPFGNPPPKNSAKKHVLVSHTLYRQNSLHLFTLFGTYPSTQIFYKLYKNGAAVNPLHFFDPFFFLGGSRM